MEGMVHFVSHTSKMKDGQRFNGNGVGMIDTSMSEGSSRCCFILFVMEETGKHKRNQNKVT